MQPRTVWRWCAIAGGLAFLCSWGFGKIPGLVACGLTGGLGPIIAFEFVRSTADVMALFGQEPCRSTFAAAQTAGLLLDGFGFIPAYTTFLILATMASTGITYRWPPFAMVAAAMLAFAGLLDEIEGALLYMILHDLPGSQGVIDALRWEVHAKFALLALGTLGIAATLISTRRAVAILAGVIVGVGALKAGHGLAVAPAGMMAGFAIAWVTILLCALSGSWQPSLFSGRAGPPPALVSPSA